MAAALPSPWPGAIAAPDLQTGQLTQSTLYNAATDVRLDEVEQVQKGLVWYNPQVSPLLRISSRAKNPRTVENTRFYHLEQQRLPRTIALDASAAVEAGTATTPTALKINPAHMDRIRVNDLLYNTSTGDVALVTAKTDADTIAVTANIGDSSPSGTLYANSQSLLQIGNAYLDGEGLQGSVQVVEDEKMFFCQIFKDVINQSRRFQQTAFYSGDPKSRGRQQAEFEHTLSQEYAMFLGKPDLKLESGKLRGFMGGVNHYASINRVDFDGDTTVTKAFIDQVMIGAMKEGKNGYENREMASKTLFGSAKWISALNTVGESQIRVIEPSQKTFGLKISQYQGSWGVLNFVNTPVLNSPGLDQYAFILDLDHVRPAYFKGGNTSFTPDADTKATDGQRGFYLTDRSFIVELAAAHTVLENLG
jgi:hypothetical protein